MPPPELDEVRALEERLLVLPQKRAANELSSPQSQVSTPVKLDPSSKRLRLLTKVTKREMSHSFGFMQNETKKVALNNIAIPVGATAAAGMILNKVVSSNNNPQITKVKNGNIASIAVALIPFAMKFLEDRKKENKL